MNTPVSTRTTCCKVLVESTADTALRATQAAFNQAASFCARIAWEQHITNKTRLHKLVYAATRSTFGLGAQLACCARDKAREAVRAVRAAPQHRNRRTNQVLPKTCPTFEEDSSIRYDARTYRVMRLDQVSLYTLTGRVIGRMQLGDFQRRALSDRTWKLGGAELIRRAGDWYLHITQTKAAPEPDEPTGYLGVDLGIVHLATDSDGASYTGAKVEGSRRRYARRRGALQRVGTKSAKRGLKKLGRKQSRFQRDINHQVSKRLVGTAKGTGRGIALEDLQGIRERVTVQGADQRARHSNWAFLQLRQFVSYKAEREGVVVVAVDPRHTSQRCSRCGHIERANRKTQADFCCVVCQFACPADYNAAINIERAAVNQPMVSNLRVEAQAQVL